MEHENRSGPGGQGRALELLRLALQLPRECPRPPPSPSSTFPLDLEKFNGDASSTLPIPARFVIDPHGIIRAAESDPDYTTRPELEDTLEAVRVLSGQS
jgi:hypothetical protein